MLVCRLRAIVPLPDVAGYMAGNRVCGWGAPIKPHMALKLFTARLRQAQYHRVTTHAASIVSNCLGSRFWFNWVLGVPWVRWHLNGSPVFKAMTKSVFFWLLGFYQFLHCINRPKRTIVWQLVWFDAKVTTSCA